MTRKRSSRSHINRTYIDKYAGYSEISNKVYTLHQNCYGSHETVCSLLNMAMENMKEVNVTHINCDMCGEFCAISINSLINQLGTTKKLFFRNKMKVINSSILRESYKKEHNAIECPRCVNGSDIDSLCFHHNDLSLDYSPNSINDTVKCNTCNYIVCKKCLIGYNDKKGPNKIYSFGVSVYNNIFYIKYLFLLLSIINVVVNYCFFESLTHSRHDLRYSLLSLLNNINLNNEYTIFKFIYFIISNTNHCFFIANTMYNTILFAVFHGLQYRKNVNIHINLIISALIPFISLFVFVMTEPNWLDAYILMNELCFYVYVLLLICRSDTSIEYTRICIFNDNSRNFFHNGKTCETISAMIKSSNLSIMFDSMQCSKCNKLVHRPDGCNHMTCRCGHEFCYLCEGNWLYHEYNDCIVIQYGKALHLENFLEELKKNDLELYERSFEKIEDTKKEYLRQIKI